MRFILALTVIATASMDSAAQDLVFEHRRRDVGSNGVRRTKERDELPHLGKAILEEEDGGGEKLEEEVGVVIMNGDDEKHNIVFDLIDQNDNVGESNQSSHPTIVKWAEKAKETTTGTKETKSKKGTSKKTRTKKISEDTLDSDHAGVHGSVIDEHFSSLDFCPPGYSVSVTYKAGDTIESHSDVWECQAAPYEKYCSIELDEDWNDNEKELWRGSWVLIGTCEKLVATENPTKDPTPSPTKEHTNSPTLSDVNVKMSSTEPPCPLHYNASATYVAGDTIEMELNIWKCRHTPYEKYCSIAEVIETWSDEKKALWEDAWVHVSACKKPNTPHGDASASDSEMAEDSITTTSPTATIATKTEATISSTIASLPLCPSVYNPQKTNYVAGEQVTVKCKIFQCKDEDHEIYCNVSTWDDSLPVDMWKDAWELVGDCQPTQGEFMEEEAADGVGTWNCLG